MSSQEVEIMDLKHDTIPPSYSDESSGEEITDGDPNRKRKRATKISCEICKVRKVKCDKAEPACGWCVKNDRMCIYKERRRVLLKASYGVEIEDKIKSIESQLQSLTQRFEDQISANTGDDRSLSKHNSYGRTQSVLSSRSYPDSSQKLPPPFVRTADSEGSGSVQPAQPSNGLSINSLLGSGGSFASNSKPASSSLLAEQLRDDELPPQDMLFHIVDMYFKHVNTWSPILDRKATLNSLFGKPGTIDDENVILLHGIIAVALRFCRDTRLPDEARQRYREISRQKVQLQALGNPSMKCLEALALVTVDVLGTSSGPQGWNLIALLARNIVWMGLHVEKRVYLAHSLSSETTKTPQIPNLLQPNTWTEDEGWRRLYWLTYILDRYATIATSFDFVLDEREADRQLPCRYDLFSKNQAVETRWFWSADSMETRTNHPENLGSFSYHCGVLRILSQIHKFLRRPIDIESASEIQQWRDTYRELDSRLSSWLMNLPGEYGKISQLCHSDPGARVSNWIMIHAAFVTAVIRLHSVAAYPSARSVLFQSSHNASQRCLAAVQSLVAIAQDVIDTSMLDLLGPPFAFSLWTSSRLLLVHSATTETPIDPNIWFLISTLAKMGQYWNVAQSWAEILDRLVREGQRADDDNRAGRVEASGKTYHEMRRYAHDLSTMTTRPPQTVLDPPATRFASSNELEYFEVFEWFSYPKVHVSSDHANRGIKPHSPYLQIHGDNDGGNNSSSNNNSGSHHSRRKLSTSDGTSGDKINSNSSNTNTNTEGSEPKFFTIPNPDSDWLDYRQPYEFHPPFE